MQKRGKHHFALKENERRNWGGLPKGERTGRRKMGEEESRHERRKESPDSKESWGSNRLLRLQKD